MTDCSTKKADLQLGQDAEGGAWGLIRRLLRLSWQYRWGCLRVLILNLLILLFALGGLNLTGVGIDFIRHLVDTTQSPPAWPLGLRPPAGWAPMRVLTGVALGVLAAALFRVGLRFLFQIEIAKLTQGRIVVDLRSQVYDKLQRLSFRFFDENESGAIINRVAGDVQATRMFIDTILVQGVNVALTLALSAVYMFSIHAPLAFATLATTPALWLLCLRFSRLVKPAYSQNRKLVDKLILVLSESIGGIRVIKGFAREEETVGRFTQANAEVRNQSFTIFDRVTTYGPLIGFVSELNLVVLLAYGGWLAIRGEILLGSGLVVFSGLLQQFTGQISQLVQLANNIQHCLISSRRVFEVLDTPVEIKSPPNPKPLPGGTPCAIEFDRVSFAYRQGAPVLQNLSFRVEPGEMVAILGATGSGKSTMLSLIPRFYDPMAGSVRINGVDIREYDLDDLRRAVGIVFQENFLFSTSIRDNIAFGHPGAAKQTIIEAARTAAAHDFISAFPKGYGTILGEGGAGISGGQRQRIAIARAILLQPSILLLDDPTAAIDAQTEHEIMHAMESATRGRTTFLVAHRVSSLRRADRVLVLNHGVLVQQGRHEELMRQDGPYRWMVEVQEAAGGSVAEAGGAK